MQLLEAQDRAAGQSSARCTSCLAQKRLRRGGISPLGLLKHFPPVITTNRDPLRPVDCMPQLLPRFTLPRSLHGSSIACPAYPSQHSFLCLDFC